MNQLKFNRVIVAIAMMLIGWLPSLAHDFEVDGIYYDYYDKINSCIVEVTYKGYYPDNFSNEYAGYVVIPSSVNYNGTTYSVISIGYMAFQYCENLTSIEIPNSVTSIGDGAFCWCTGLTSIVVDSGNTKYDSRNGCNAIIETASNTLIAGCQNTIIPNSVTIIGNWAFYGCSSLTSIQIPNSVTSIGGGAFQYCSSLTKIICWATTPPTIESDTFSNYSADLYVPEGCKSVYESAEYWKNFNIINNTLDNPITLNDCDAIIATIGNEIVVKNATVGSVVRIYSIDGALIVSEEATDGEVVVKAPAKGIYVVAIDGKSFKVMVK